MIDQVYRKSIPPDFTDEASYRAYLKAEAAGLIRVYGKPRSQARAPVKPSDFTDEASYRAYLKADAAGLIRVYGQAPVQRNQPTVLQAHPAPASVTWPASFKVGADGLVRVYNQAPAAPSPASLAARNACPAGTQGGAWADCQGFVGIAALKAI